MGLRIVLPYLVFAGLWILVSDRILMLLVPDAATIAQWSIVKGLAFVLVTAMLLGFLLHAEWKSRAVDQAALHSRDALLRDMGRIAHMGGWEFDPATGRVTWTEEVARIHELDPAEPTCVEKSLRFFQGEHRAAIERAIREAVEQGKPYDLELELVTSAGNRKWIRTMGQPVRENGAVIRVRGALQDITQFKRQEASLAALARRQQELVRVIQRIAVARTETDVMAAVRTAARHLTDADGATFVLRDGDQCFYADEDAIQPLWKGRRFPLSACVSGWSMLHRQTVVIEDIYQDERIPLDAYRPTFVRSLIMVPIRAAEPIGAIGTYWAQCRRPAADEVHLLETLANAAGIALDSVRLYHELEGRVQARTAELQAANQELEAFSYSVSHDLRAPLRHIGGFTDLLANHLDQSADATTRRYVSIIRSAVGEMGQLIDDLLRFSRMSRAEMTRSRVSLHDLARDVSQALAAEAAGREVEWRIAPLPQVPGDPAMLKIVLANLMGNSLKYSRPTPKAVIEVGVLDGGAPGEVVCYVRDNGVGFDMRYAGKLFGVFQRLHSSGEFEGTGIGLATVRRIIARHGGRTWAEGEIGKGATVYFALPSAEPNTHNPREDHTEDTRP